MKKFRVKCANCGMIYDIAISEIGEHIGEICCCPGCKSNAYDVIKDISRGYKNE